MRRVDTEIYVKLHKTAETNECW